MKNSKAVKLSLSIVLVTALSLHGYAQKLKSIQEASVRAPVNIKVDGKLTEWDDTFQAFNPTTSLNYTLSNDDKFLYLAIKSTDQTNSNKIAAAGINFTINTADKKKEKDAFAVIFPMPNKDIMTSILPQRGGPGGGGPGGGGDRGGPPGGGGFGGGQGGPPPGGGNPFTLDSTALSKVHAKTIDAAKEIKLVGFKDVPDSVISIYNEYSFKASIGYDTKGNLTYEVAIPLKSLGLSTDNPKEFYYNLKVNAVQMPDRGNRDRGGQDGGGPPGGGGDRGGQGGGGAGGGGAGGGAGGDGFRGGGQGGPPGGGGGPFAAFQAMMSSTDFWGKYTLAKNK
jgi:hypothetical protein